MFSFDALMLAACLPVLKIPGQPLSRAWAGGYATTITLKSSWRALSECMLTPLSNPQWTSQIGIATPLDVNGRPMRRAGTTPLTATKLDACVGGICIANHPGNHSTMPLSIVLVHTGA